jgi:hypothetical protein
VNIKILESAQKDLKEGLGRYFLETLVSDIESLRIFAGVHSIHFGKYYRLLSKRFPFAVYYLLWNYKTVGSFKINNLAKVSCHT